MPPPDEPAIGYPPVPVDGYAVSWESWESWESSERSSSERCTLRWENEGWTVEGVVTGVDVHYVVRLSARWRVQQVLLFRDLPDPDLWLATDGGGRWGEVGGAHRVELDGCVDVEIGCTPFTYSLPIRRLPLAVGESARTEVVTVDVETLAVRREQRTYTRSATHRFTIQGTGGSATAVEVDEYGLVIDEPNRFRRVQAST